MSAGTATAARAAAADTGRRGRFGRLLSSEWTKFRSVRSTPWALIILVIVAIGFTVLFTALTSAQWNKTDAGDRATLLSDPTAGILGPAVALSQLAIAVLGVLVITTEYSTGVIRASLLAVPTRLPMLAAKAVVLAVVAFVLGEIVSFACFFIGSAILKSHVPVSLGDPGVLRPVIGAGLYLTVLGLFALGIGAIVRITAASITGVIAFVLVIAPLAQLLPGSIGKHVHAYLPTEAGALILKTRQGTDDLLTPWQGFGVFCLWTVAVLALGAWVLQRRDA